MPARFYRHPKHKRHLYLTDEAFDHVSSLAKAKGSSPSEVVEQLIRLHLQAIAIPSTQKAHHGFPVAEAEQLQKEVSSGSGRFINPSKIDGETRIRLFGEGVTGYEGWTTDSKPVRWESRPAELPENILTNEDGRDTLKRFVAAIAW